VTSSSESYTTTDLAFPAVIANVQGTDASPAFATVSRCVPSEQETRVRIPLNGLERLWVGLCEKRRTAVSNHPGGQAPRREFFSSALTKARPLIRNSAL
jgi:hypothetical protein